MSQLTRWGLLLAALAVASKGLGVVRGAVTAYFFGAGPELNAYVLAKLVPLLGLNILFGAAILGAFIPAFSRRRQEAGEAEAWRYAVSIFVLVVGASSSVAALLAMLAPQAVAVLGPGLDAETLAVAARYLRWVLVALPLFAAATVMAAVLNSYDEFRAPGLRPLLQNGAVVTALLLFGGGLGVEALIIGFVTGAALQILIQVPPLVRLADGNMKSPRMRMHDLREFGVTYLPIFATHMMLQATLALDRAFGTISDPRGAAAVEFAEPFVDIARTVVGGSLAVVIFPHLSRVASAGREDSTLVGRALGVVSLTTLPLTLAYVLFGGAVVSVVLQHGSFGSGEAALTQAALLGLAPVATLYPMLYVFDRLFIANNRAWTYAGVLAAALAVNLATKLALQPHLGLTGVTAGTSAGALFAVVVGGLAFRRWGRAGFLPTALHDLLTAAGCFGVSFGSAWAASRWLPVPAAWQAWAGIGWIVAAGLLGTALLHLTRPPAYRLAWEKLRQTLERR